MGLAAIAAVVAALLLSGCGRKGPLDPPPAAAVPAPEGTATPPAGTAAKPVASPEQKRHLPIDVLLN